MISFRGISETLFRNKPDAVAVMKGGPGHGSVRGRVLFYRVDEGILVAAHITGLPQTETACTRGIYGFHLHEGTACTGNAQDAFADALGHYNPNGCSHPYHAGDFPPIFADGSCAFLVFLDGQLTLEEIIGKTVILHAMPDDLMTQPSGNSGQKIACGVVRKK